MEREQPRVVYNFGGGLPLTTTRRDLRSLCKGVNLAGYDGIYLLPFRVLTNTEAIKELSQTVKVCYLTNAWNPTNQDLFPLAVAEGLIGIARRRLGDESQPPILQDALFPSRTTCNQLFGQLATEFPQAKIVVNDFEEIRQPPARYLVQVKPQPNDLETIQRALRMSQEEQVSLTFDPFHLLSSNRVKSYPNRPTRQSQNDWERPFLALAPHIEVVDINTPKREHIPQFCRGEGPLWEFARAAKSLKHLKAINVEIPMPTRLLGQELPFATPWIPIGRQEGFEFLQEIAQAIKTA